MNKLDYLSILNELKNIDISKFKYKDNVTKSELICKEHGVFKRSIKQIKKGILCPLCSDRITNTEKYIEKCKLIHDNKYNYSTTFYKNSRTRIEIKCDTHGSFKLFPIQHLRGQDCKKCKLEESKKDFIRKASLIHNYDYSKVNYINNKTSIIVICNKHGDFLVRPDNHLNLNNGCPKCNSSKGELAISEYLNNLQIEYYIQKKFDDCKYKYKLRFDFYLPKYNLCIEYNGIQHYEAVEYFGGKKSLEYNIIKDNIKKKYCLENKIILFIIKYNDNIENKSLELKNYFK